MHPTWDVLPAANQLMSGLVALRQAGVVHSDLKPANILVMDELPGRRPTLKLSDLGSSFAPDIPSTKPTYMGSYPWRAPETYMGFGGTFSVDMWAAGLIVYQMLAGTHLFDGVAESEVPKQIVHWRGFPQGAFPKEGAFPKGAGYLAIVSRIGREVTRASDPFPPKKSPE